MKIYLNDKLSKDFPMTAFEIQDTIDMLNITHDNPIVNFKISQYDNMELSQMLCDREFSADIYMLNLFAERFEKLDFSETAAMKSLLLSKPESSFEDMLFMTYGLDSVPVWPCKNYYELGEAVIENEMLHELKDCSDKIYEYLDKEYIGKTVCSQNGGVFVDDVYCEPHCYVEPDIQIKIGQPEKCFFRLLIVPEDEKIENAMWISLPCKTEITANYYNGLCLDFQSALPDLKFNDMHKIETLNKLAMQISILSKTDFVKLKAVMEAENIHDAAKTLDCIGSLDEYQFDRFVSDQSKFGRAYLPRNLPANFDISTLENMDLYDFGEKILLQAGGEITSYGAISGRSQELYSVLTAEPVQQIDEESEEDFEIEMGGMSL